MRRFATVLAVLVAACVAPMAGETEAAQTAADAFDGDEMTIPFALEPLATAGPFGIQTDRPVTVDVVQEGSANLRLSLAAGQQAAEGIQPSVVAPASGQALAIRIENLAVDEVAVGILRVRMAAVTPKPQPLVPGELVETVAASPHPYDNSTDQTWTVTVPPGAARLRMHFARIETESCCDHVSVLDGGGEVIETYQGDYPTGTWTNWIEGDSAYVRLAADGSQVGWGFEVDRVEYLGGTPAQTADLVIESAHPYANGMAQRWAVSAAPGAEQMRIHFAAIRTESCCDRVAVLDGQERPVHEYQGDLSGGAWTSWIPGDTAFVELTTDGTQGEYGFAIDRIEFVGGSPILSQAMSIGSPHPYGSDANQSVRVVAPPGAHQMRIHFEQIATEANVDLVTVTDSEGNARAVYSGDSQLDVTTAWLPGDQATVTLTSDGSVASFGYQIDRIDYAY